MNNESNTKKNGINADAPRNSGNQTAANGSQQKKRQNNRNRTSKNAQIKRTTGSAKVNEREKIREEIDFEKDAFVKKLNEVRKPKLGLASEGMPTTAPISLKKREQKPVNRQKRTGARPADAVSPARAHEKSKQQPQQKKQQQPQQQQTAVITPAPRHSNNKSGSKHGDAMPLKVMMLGGLHEIGKNLTVFEYGDDMIIVDCGLAFPDQDMLGIDVVIPDMTYIEENRSKLRGIVITHGHEDHIGALPYALKKISAPIYATKMTLGLIEGKLAEHGLKGKVNMNTVKAGQTIKLGCFTVEFIAVNHSIPDAVGLAIKTPVGMIVHTGDFKIDTTPTQGDMIDLARFAQLGSEGVLALFMDSTNAERPGYTISEQRVGQSLGNIFKNAEGKRIIIATFSSNVYRVQQIIDIAAGLGRKVALSGRSMVNVATIAAQLGYINIPEGVLVDINSIDRYRKDEMVVITTGSQGETMSALYRMAYSDHRKIAVSEDDLIVLSSNPIPGNEKFVTNIVNELLKLGCSVVYESLAEVHTSGHACQEELKLMLGLVKPKFYIPVHGEYKHLKKAEMLGMSMGIPKSNILLTEIGKVIELTPDSIAVKGEVQTGSVFVDGLSVGDVGNIVMRDRRLLAEDGLVLVVATVRKSDGTLVSEPEIISRGFVYMRESEELIGKLSAAAKDCIVRNAKIGTHDYNALKTAVRDDMAKLIYQQSKRTPVVIPVIVHV